MTNNEKLRSFAPAVLRFTLVFVYAWFGLSQLVNPESWAAIVPDWATGFSGLEATLIVRLNGTFEVVFSLLLALGLFVRSVAALLFFHLIVIASSFGLTPTGVRDFGLSFATLALALFGEDQWCLGYTREAQKETSKRQ